MPEEQPIDRTSNEDVRRICKILEPISKGYPKDSEERWAIHKAAMAVNFVVSRRLEQEFREFVYPTLTERQKEHLRSMGYEYDDKPG